MFFTIGNGAVSGKGIEFIGGKMRFEKWEGFGGERECGIHTYRDGYGNGRCRERHCETAAMDCGYFRILTEIFLLDAYLPSH